MNDVDISHYDVREFYTKDDITNNSILDKYSLYQDYDIPFD